MSIQDEKGAFDEAFDVTEDDYTMATKPMAPWPDKTRGDAVIKSFVKSPEPGKSGYHSYRAAFDVTATIDGKPRTKQLNDFGVSLSPKAKGKFVQFCRCFGLNDLSEINAVRRGELNPTGLTGPVVLGIREADDGNTYNEIKRYLEPKK